MAEQKQGCSEQGERLESVSWRPVRVNPCFEEQDYPAPLNQLWLTDSRSRGPNGGGMRTVYVFPDSNAGVKAAWEVVIANEVPEERADYIGIAEPGSWDACEVFNDYWACYGWWLALYDLDADRPDDCVFIMGEDGE